MYEVSGRESLIDGDSLHKTTFSLAELASQKSYRRHFGLLASNLSGLFAYVNSVKS